MRDDRKREFDLNIEKVLDGWLISHAVRELIANALDEQVLSATDDIRIIKRGRDWTIRDFGRGLKYEHLTQNENPEKRRNASKVVGRFGVGLKDALAVLHRHGLPILLRSKHGDITLSEQSKAHFDDVVTLHAVIAPPSDPRMHGTEVVLRGLKDSDIKTAQDYFLHFAKDEVLDDTKYGQILARRPGRIGRIYVNGLVVAEEDNFLFSYNITNLTAPMKKALNRERTNVGRGAYSDRVKAMLLSSESQAVAQLLAEDLEGYADGTCHDETTWKDVQIRACQVLNPRGDVVFVCAIDLKHNRDMVDMAEREGRTIITVPNAVAIMLNLAKDVNGNPIATLKHFAAQWSDSFAFTFIEPERLTAKERRVFELTPDIFRLAGGKPVDVQSVRISETMRPSMKPGADTDGLWDPATGTIIIHRDQLASVERFAGTLLHELAHAESGFEDVSREFELALTDLLGVTAAHALIAVMRSRPSRPTEPRAALRARRAKQRRRS